MRAITSVELAAFERLTDVGSLLIRRGDAQMRASSGATGIQYEILIRLRNAGGELRMNELAHALTQTPSGLTYQVRQLETRGYVQRARASYDERGVLARITDKGREFLVDQRDNRAEFIQKYVVDPLTDDDIEALHAILGKLQVALRGEMTGGILPEDVEEPA